MIAVADAMLAALRGAPPAILLVLPLRVPEGRRGRKRAPRKAAKCGVAAAGEAARPPRPAPAHRGPVHPGAQPQLRAGRQEAELWQAFAEAAGQLSSGGLPVGLGAGAPGWERVSCRGAWEANNALVPSKMPLQGEEDHQGPAPSTLSRTTASTRSDRSRSPDGGSLKLATEVVDGHQGAASSMAHTSAAGAGTRDLLHQALPPSLPSQRSLPVTAARASVRGGGGRAVAPGAFRQSPPPQSQDPPGFAAAAAAEPAGGKPAWQPNPDAPVFVPAPTDQDRCYSDGSPACDEDRSKGGAQLAAWRLARTPPARTAARPRASPAAVHSAPPKASVKPPGTFRPPVVAPAPSAAPSPPPATCPALPPLGSAAAPPTAASDRGLRLPAAPGTLPAPPPVEAHGAPASAGGYCTAAVAVAPAVALAVVLVAGAIAGVPDHLVQLGSAPAHAAALARSLSVDVELLRASAPGLLTIAAQGCHSAAVAGLQPECGAARSAPPMAEEGEAGDSETSLADHGHWFL
ncbi:unnamed protein product [Prorocentrum cordatum]|uniref:Nascent polypeptide-associated complex subunit alpha, muscle-specific form-like n=1 Tax=Prorocentrum cordatum TaxID=2364126 RepID=A0ABN9VU81_9DINO|nr:unnamed protein product [Polarella glacialis]